MKRFISIIFSCLALPHKGGEICFFMNFPGYLHFFTHYFFHRFKIFFWITIISKPDNLYRHFIWFLGKNNYLKHCL